TSALSGVYDAWNRAVQWKLGDDSLARYAYDGLNRRTVLNDDRINWDAFTLDQWDAYALSQWQTFVLNSQSMPTSDRLGWNSFTLAQWVGFSLRQWETFRLEVTRLTGRHYYYSDSWQVLEERIGPTDAPERQFVWGLRYLDDLVLRERFAGDES